MQFMLIVTVLILCALLQFAKSATNKVICYYESWAASSYPPESIDTNICTHINYAFLGITEDGSLRLDNGDDILKRLSVLKSTRNSKPKLLISVGGWSEGSVKFSHVAANASAKINLAHSVLYYMRTYNFDGVDIDWEYPAERDGSTADKENFIDMLWVIRNLFKQNGGGLITVAVSSSPYASSYNVQAISQVVDFINVMTYDFTQPSPGGKTGANSPLYGTESCDTSIKNWLKGGASSEKLVLGLPFYGYTYQLKDSNQNGMGAPVAGKGINNGEMKYSDLCKLNAYTEKWDDFQKVPYKYSGNQWISFDNPRSIGLKVSYAKGKNLGGVMIWAVDQDDKDGACGSKNSLLQAIKRNL